jgi:hypothetical protein
MEQDSERSRLEELMRQVLERIKKRPEPEPEDPYAYVGAPKKPRPPQRGAAAAEPLE